MFVSSHASFRFIEAQIAAADSTVRRVSYPDHVLFHARLRDLTEEHVEVLAETPGFHCRLQDDGDALVSITFAHDVPSHPDTDALECRLRLALEALVPGAEVVDIRHGVRYARDAGSPAAEALHRLRRDVHRASLLEDLEAVERDQLAEALHAVFRDFNELDEVLCNGGTVPSDWARRHPEGDRGAALQMADNARTLEMAS